MRVPHSVPTQTPQWLVEARIRGGKPGYPHFGDHRDATVVAEDIVAATEPTDQRITYRGYVITYDPPPIPDRRWDWQFQHEQFDGAEDSRDNRYGQAASLTDCFCAIDEVEDGAP